MTTRIQRKRVAGWRKPAGAIDCTRPGRWGNTYRIRQVGDQFAVIDAHDRFCGPTHATKAEANAAAVELFKHKLLLTLAVWPEYLEPLRGHDLMCWCKNEDACHADVLLEFAAFAPWVPDGGGV